MRLASQACRSSAQFCDISINRYIEMAFAALFYGRQGRQRGEVSVEIYRNPFNSLAYRIGAADVAKFVIRAPLWDIETREKRSIHAHA
jgi:hypothetical protein